MLQWMVDNNMHRYIAYFSLILMVGAAIWLFRRYTSEVLRVLRATAIGAFACGLVGVLSVSCLYWIAQLFKYIIGEQVLLFSADLAEAQLFFGGLLGIVGGVLGLLITLAIIGEEKTKETSDSSEKDNLNSKSVSK